MLNNFPPALFVITLVWIIRCLSKRANKNIQVKPRCEDFKSRSIIKIFTPARKAPLTEAEQQAIEAHVGRAIFSRTTPGWGAPKERNTNAVRSYAARYLLKHGELPMGRHEIASSGAMLPNPIFLRVGDFIVEPPEDIHPTLH